MLQVFGTIFFGAEPLYRNIFECKKYVSIVDRTDFVFFSVNKEESSK